jgi:hypothetical protein
MGSAVSEGDGGAEGSLVMGPNVDADDLWFTSAIGFSNSI